MAGCTALSYRLLRNKSCLLVHLNYIFFKLGSRKSSIANCSYYLSKRLDAHISRCKKSLSCRHLRFIRYDVASFINLCKSLYKACLRGIACKYKHTEGIIFYLVSGLFSCYSILPGNASKHSITLNPYNFFVVKYGYILICLGLICCSLGTGKIFFSNKDGYMLCVFCKEYTFLRRSKSTAYYKDVLSCKELTVTDSTISHSMSLVLCLSLEAYHPRVCTCSKKYAKAVDLALGGLNLLYIIIHIY